MGGLDWNYDFLILLLTLAYEARVTSIREYFSIFI